MLANVPPLLYAWCRSAAWTLACVSSCVLLRGWADEHSAFEVGGGGDGQLALLLLAVSVAAVLFHVQAYKKFQRSYVIWAASWPPTPGESLAVAWLMVLGLLRVGWVMAVLGLFVLVALFTGSSADAGWR